MPRPFLTPVDRASEVLFGLIMVLTFTGSLSAAEAGRAEVRAMLIGALGCNIAWGIIDAILYLMGSLAERGRMLVAWNQVRESGNAAESHRIIAGALPDVVASAMKSEEYETIRRSLVESPGPPSHPRLEKDELLGAVGVFLWVFFVTLPVAVPFLLIHDAIRALRISNAIAVVMLFFAGYSLARHAGLRPWRFGLAMVGIGVLLVGLTIALGG